MPLSPQLHVSLTITQKQEIADEYFGRKINGEDVSQHRLAEWTQNKFRLLRTPNQATISRLLRVASDRSLSTTAHRIRLRTSSCKELEEALMS